LPYSIEDIVGLDSFSPEDIAAIQSAMKSDDSLKAAVSKWIAVSHHVRQSIESDFPSNQALVCFALRERLTSSDWTNQESDVFKRAESEMLASIERHSSITRIISRIQADASAFERIWNSEFALGDRAPIARRFSGLRLVRLAVSAVAVVVLIAFGVTRFSAGPESSLQVIESVAGAYKQITLNDGSTVRLASDSKLSWEGDFNRKLSLQGSAFFEVYASSEPFVIETEVGITTVLGTSFGIETVGSPINGQSVVKVTLVSGRVSLSNTGSESVILSPGEQGIISKSGISISEVNLTHALVWSELLVFRDTPMKDVVAELERRFKVKIGLDESLASTPLTGTFDQERGVREILDIMAAALSAKLSVDEQTGELSLERSVSAGL